MLKMLRESGVRWNKRTCSAAALNGHPKMLQWARANGCPWDYLVCNYAANEGGR